jgi:gluconokinase
MNREKMNPIVIGLDLGTTACKAVAFASDGSVVASASGTYGLQTPQPGWAEQNPHEIWNVVRDVLRELAEKMPIERVAGMSLCGAMHSLMPVAEGGTPLAHASIWADGRATEQGRRLRTQTDTHALYERTGCPVQPLYHAARLRWWHEEQPDTARQAARWAAIKDWVLYRLTGVWATDVGLASTTGLLDIHRFQWDEEALALAGVAAERLPTLVSPLDVVGGVRAEVARETGLPSGLPIVAGSSDGGVANLGAGVFRPGQVVITVGTSGAVRRVVEQPWLDARERTWCYLLSEGRWFAGGAINNGGLTTRWVREQFYAELEDDAAYERLSADAGTVAAGAEGVLLLPYFTGERSPHWDPEARALIYGLGLQHGRPHLARAALEGVAFCLADVWEALVREEPASVYVTGGVSESEVWLEILADVLGVAVTQMQVEGASAMGAAMLGHEALGHVPGGEVFARRVQGGRVFEPDAERHRVYQERHTIFQKLYQEMVEP